MFSTSPPIHFSYAHSNTLSAPASASLSKCTNQAKKFAQPWPREILYQSGVCRSVCVCVWSHQQQVDLNFSCRVSLRRLPVWCRTNKFNSCECFQNKWMNKWIKERVSAEPVSLFLSSACQEWCPTQSGVPRQESVGCRIFPAWLKRECCNLNQKVQFAILTDWRFGAKGRICWICFQEMCWFCFTERKKMK